MNVFSNNEILRFVVENGAIKNVSDPRKMSLLPKSTGHFQVSETSAHGAYLPHFLRMSLLFEISLPIRL